MSCKHCGNPGYAPHSVTCPDYTSNMHRTDGRVSDSHMEALRQVVMSQAVRYVDSWQIGDGPATLATAIAAELNEAGWSICPTTT